jgi:polyisoprenoid-binding protein YceI
MSVSTVAVPQTALGAWVIDNFNSDVSFMVRHLGISKVHGRFNDVSGQIVINPEITRSGVTATIGAQSIDTGFPARDAYIKGDAVLAVAEHEQLTFASTELRVDGERYLLDGDLTIRGVTRPVTLELDLGGFGTDPTTSNQVMGISARTSIQRADFGLATPVPGAVISDRIEVRLDIQAVRES